MTDTSRLICSITAFIFLSLFVLVEYLPANYILERYMILTSERAVLNLISFIPIMIFFSLKTRDFGYSLLLIIVMVGQIMFVHVYADNYTIVTSSNEKKSQRKVQIYYSHDWNKA